MSEAPKYCADCPLSPTLFCEKRTSAYDAEGCITYHPGPQCPFVQLSEKDAEIEAQRLRIIELRECKQAEAEYLAKDAEIERLRYRLAVTAEKYHAKADHGGMFDECGLRSCTENRQALSLDNPPNNP